MDDLKERELLMCAESIKNARTYLNSARCYALTEQTEDLGNKLESVTQLELDKVVNLVDEQLEGMRPTIES